MDVMMGGTEGSDTVAGVVLGVDTHLDLHVAVALDQLGRHLGELTVPTTAKGYQNLLCWAESFGPVRCAGVEGTGSYGAGLARHLRSAGIAVFEVERPKAPSSTARGEERLAGRGGRGQGGVGRGDGRGAQERRRPRADGPGSDGGPPLGGEGP